jgi:vitamin B12 transporter
MKQNKKLSTSLVASLLIATTTACAKYDITPITITSASKTEQSIKDVTANVEVITKEEIEDRHYTSITEALNSLSGISFSRNGGMGGSTSLNLRGTNNNRTLILIDGVRFKDQSSISGTDISNLMVTDIERIEVIKGAQSGIWGADAAAGVINIITRSAKNGFHGSAFVEGGSFDTKKYGSWLSYRNDKFSLKVDAQKIDSDSFTSKTIKRKNIDSFEDDSYENTTVSLKGSYNITNTSEINFNVIDIDSFKEYDASNPNDTSMKNDSETRIYTLGYDQKYKNHNFTLKFDKTRIQRDQIGTTWGVKYTNNEIKNFEILDNISYNTKDFFVLGAGVTKDEIAYTKADSSKADASNKAKYIYATNSNYFDSFILTQSLRYDSFDNFDNKLTGKIGARYSFNSGVILSTNIGTSYSVPQLIQNINPWGATNYDISPEKSKSYDLSLEYEGLKATYFYQKVEDLIDWYDPTPTNYFNNDAIYKNLDGTSKFKGLELSYKKDLLDDLLATFSYTRLSAKNADNEFLAKRAKNSFKFAFDYYGIDSFHFNVNGEYIGTRYDETDSKGEQTGRYTLFNSVINYSINDKTKLYLKLDNITDKYYQTVDGYATAGRSAYVGLKVSF